MPDDVTVGGVGAIVGLVMLLLRLIPCMPLSNAMFMLRLCSR